MSAQHSKSAFLIPAYNAGGLLGPVLGELKRLVECDLAFAPEICVVDDGSEDDTALVAERAGVTLLRHGQNRGKGAALKTGLTWAKAQGIGTLVTLDADGQHPPGEALTLFLHSAESEALLLSVRDLKGAGAPRANQRSNAFSNSVLSLMAGKKLLDTQCGLRRYPVQATLELACPEDGYAFESDIVLRAARTGMSIAHENVRVIYPPEEERLTFFDSVRDPAKIVRRVLITALTLPHYRASRRWGRRALFLGLLGFCLCPFFPSLGQ